jgi:predicted transposase YbfD/YdcC
VSLDGKAVRRACARGSGAPVIETAWVDGADAPLGEVRVDLKENEIVAIPKLLSMLSLEGAVVTIDAIGCQKEIARAIRAANAHYLLPLKDNQPTMHAEVLMFMEDLIASGAKGLTFSRHVDKGHGRVEVRRVWHSSDVAWFADRAEWKDLAGFVMVETVRTVNGIEGRPERRCFITSLKADAKAFRKLVRRHWGIENRLHWVLDVVFLEDQCRARTGHAPENCSTLRKIALMLLRRNAIGGMGVGPMRKECAWDFDSAKKVFLGGGGEEVAA